MEETGDFPHHLVNLKDQPPGADKKLTSLGVLWLSLLSIYIYKYNLFVLCGSISKMVGASEFRTLMESLTAIVTPHRDVSWSRVM